MITTTSPIQHAPPRKASLLHFGSLLLSKSLLHTAIGSHFDSIGGGIGTSYYSTTHNRKGSKLRSTMMHDFDGIDENDKDNSSYTAYNNQDYTGKGDEVNASARAESVNYSPDDPHVLVVGGGPCGLLTAILLRERGMHVTVLEKFPVRDKWSTKSYSINLGERGRTALLKAGLLDEVMEAAMPRDEIVVHDGISGRITTIIPKYPPDVALSRPDLSAALERVLLKKYQTKVRRGANVKELVLKRDDEKVEVILDNGESFVGTHLIGADGKWSAVRESVPYFSQQAMLRIEPSWGVHMTCPTIPSKWNKTSTVIFKPHKDAKFYVICAPLPSGACSITMVCFDETLERYPWLEPPPDRQKSWILEQVKRKQYYEDGPESDDIELGKKLDEMFREELPALLESGIGMETLKTAVIHPRVSWLEMVMHRDSEHRQRDDTNDDGGDINKPKTARADSSTHGDARYALGGIALVGDSCHACTASLGQGCNLALESAVSLAESIDAVCSNGKITVDELSDAFILYGRTRPDDARNVQAASSAASRFSYKW